MFFFPRVRPLVGMSANWTIFGGVRTQKPPKKVYLLDVESVRKILTIYNLTTTNAMLMKLTTTIYLHESVNQNPLRGRI